MSLRARLELARVELLVEVGAPLVGETVEAAMDLFKEPVPRELFCPTTRVVRRWTAEGLDSARCEIALLTNQLKDSVVSRNHPLGGLSHVIHICGNGAHILPDIKSIDCNTYQTNGNAVPTNSNPE